MRKFTCRKCGNKTYRKSGFKLKGKSMIDYRKKLTRQVPISVKKRDMTVVCLKCKHRQKFEE